MTARWLSPEWRAAELAAHRAEVAYLDAEIREHRRHIRHRKMELDHAQLAHRLELARAEVMAWRLDARGLGELRRLEHAVQVLTAERMVLADRIIEALGVPSTVDVVELLRVSHAARRHADEVARQVEQPLTGATP